MAAQEKDVSASAAQGLSASDALFMASPDSPSPLPTRDPLPSYWLQTSNSPGPEQGVYSGVGDGDGDAPSLPSTADVVIVGSGITGVSAAYHLASKIPPRYDGQPRTVVVLEARDFCSGATGRNGGHCTPLSALSYDELAEHSLHLARHLATTSREEVYGNDVGRKTDEVIRKILTFESRTAAEILMLVRMAAMKARRERAAPSASSADADTDTDTDVELVSGSNWHLCRSQEEDDACARSIENAKRGGLSDFTRQIRKVPRQEWTQRLHDPRDIVAVYEIPGSTLHPRRLVKLLWRLARDAAQRSHIDLRLYTATPVDRIQADADGANGAAPTNTVHTPRGKIHAKYVVHATNGYLSHLLPQFAGPAGVVPTRAQCRAVTPTNSPSQTEPLWEMGFSLNHGYEYLQQRPSPSADSTATSPPCIFGGGRWASRNKEFGEADDSQVNPDVSKALQRILPELFPANFDTASAPRLEWTAVMGWTKTNDPFVGPVVRDLASADGDRTAVSGQFLAAGYSGHGMTRAFSAAEVVADMICAQEAGIEWEPPVWFPLCYLTMFPSKPSQSEPSNQLRPSHPHSHSHSHSPAYAVYAAGSNSGGQLGIGHVEDSHTWVRPSCIVSGAEHAIAFPPPGSRVLSIKGGANSTLALTASPDGGDGDGDAARGATARHQLWVSGDAASQFGDAISAHQLTRFQPLPLPDPTLQPKLIAAAWETSYVVYTSADPPHGDDDDDDFVVSYGQENDFGQNGRGKGVVAQSGDHTPLVLPVPARTSRSPLRITRLEASMRHVVLLATFIQNDKRVNVLIGWGAARQGQLGSNDDVEDGDGRRTTGQRTATVAWQPRLIRSWRVPAALAATETTAPFALSLGRDHTVVRVPFGWMNDDGRDGQPQLLLMGSNKNQQLQHPVIKTPLRSLGCTWNASLYLHDEATIVGSGKNDHGQLGCSGEEALGTVHLPRAVTRVESIECGSEHCLALVRSGADRAPHVYGWGWNEHGNLALGDRHGSAGEGDDEGEDEDERTPVVVWPPRDTPPAVDAAHIDAEPVGVWAGCATTFVQVRVAPPPR